VSAEVEEAVKLMRLSLYNRALFCGAQAIQWELQDLAVTPTPSLRTINRILKRQGLTHRRTGRYQPSGVVYPALEAGRANQVHESDFVGPCYVGGPVRFYSVNTVDLATGRCAVEPVLHRGGQEVVDAWWASWRRLGMPEHQQVDNEMVFYGSPLHPRRLGPLIRLCLLHRIELWFIPPGEPWRNGVVEKFNDHYEQRFLGRVAIQGEGALRAESLAFEARHNRCYRYHKLNGHTPVETLRQAQTALRFPPSLHAPRLPLQRPESGQYHVVRFIRSDRRLDVFGERFTLPPETEYEYVVGTIDVQTQKLKIHIGQEQVDEKNYPLG
jgi:putative transposase